MLVWSRKAKESDWVQLEAGQAKALNKTILPIVLDEVDSLPGFMADLKYISANGRKTEAIQEAQIIILEEYTKRQNAIADAQRKKSQDDAKFWLGAGALALWLFSK